MATIKHLRIVFMGTPHFAVGIFKALLQAGHNIVAVVTAPDRPAGRGRKMNASAVKEFALENDVPVLQPTNLKDPMFLGDLRALEADLQVVVAFRMLPKVVWQMPAKGTFNLHASLLPQYRGAAPINWAIMNGETKTGVTTFFIDDKIDTGAIILKKETEIGPEDTAGSLHDHLMELGARAVLETVDLIGRDKALPRPQVVQEPLREAPKLNKEICRLDFERSLKALYDFIRGLSPYPAAWCTLHNGEEAAMLKVFKVRPEVARHDHPSGTLLSGKKELKVAVRDGFLNIMELQLQGKRKMKVTDFLNGHKLLENAYVS
ncbi:methionyl-tRNA formyltransferase [Maribacter sp. 2307ULW6-5]|uniref:methionyl-tRNA formyltransferase n=1 Tax=Maribacter sp. 2307ULW6-5 TaxID=3386275 RepID=UPI0039BD86A8